MPKGEERMARGEGEVEGAAGLHSRFVERVVRLPMVHVAWDLASHTYGHLKESSTLARFTLTNAERSVNFVAGPVVRKFERQIQAVDDLACKGLGTLEEKVPFITKPAEEIMDDTRKLYESSVFSRIDNIRKYGNDTVKSVTDYGFQKANSILESRLVKSVLTSVDGALVVTENYIDHILPPVGEENQNDLRKESKDSKRGLVRLSLLSAKVRRRAYRNLILKLDFIQERSLELVLTYPIGWIEYSKEHLDAAVQYANRLWLAIKQEETDDKAAAEKSRVETQLLHLTRLVTRQLAKAYTTASSILPLGPTEKEDEGASSDQQPGSSTALGVAKERAVWLFGLLRMAPSLLPMYLYGFAMWLEQLRGVNPDEKEIEMKDAKSNGISNSSNHHSSSSNKNESNHTNPYENSSEED